MSNFSWKLCLDEIFDKTVWFFMKISQIFHKDCCFEQNFEQIVHFFIKIVELLTKILKFEQLSKKELLVKFLDELFNFSKKNWTNRQNIFLINLILVHNEVDKSLDYVVKSILKRK